MSDQENSQSTPGAPTPASGCRGRGRGRRLFFLVAVAIVGVLTGVALTKAVGHAHGFGHDFGFSRSAMTPEEAGRRAERFAKHLAVEVDATPEQTTKLVEIAVGAAKDVFPMREQFRDVPEEAIKLITSDAVDRNAIETLRKDQLNRIDTVTQRISTAIADAAEVLRPDQRRILSERAEDWRGWRGHRKH